MTAQKHIERIRAAHKAYKLLDTDVGRALSFERSYNIRYELSSACNPTAMSSVLAHIDLQQAEIEKLQAALTLYDTAIDGQMNEITALKAALYLIQGEHGPDFAADIYEARAIARDALKGPTP
jgi:hypothetical protein